MSARVPKYCHHKPTGQGFVKLNGRFIYLGEYDTPDSRQRYDALISEWLACGRMTHENARSLSWSWRSSNTAGDIM